MFGKIKDFLKFTGDQIADTFEDVVPEEFTTIDQCQDITKTIISNSDASFSDNESSNVSNRHKKRKKNNETTKQKNILIIPRRRYNTRRSKNNRLSADVDVELESKQDLEKSSAASSKDVSAENFIKPPLKAKGLSKKRKRINHNERDVVVNNDKYLDNYKNEIEELQTIKKEYEDQIKDLKNKSKEEQVEISKLKNQNAKLLKSNEKLKDALSKSKDELKEYKKQIELQENQSDLKTENQFLKDQLEFQKVSITKLTENINNLEDHTNLLQKKISNLEIINSKDQHYQKEINKYKEIHSEQTNTIEKLKSELKTKEKELKSIEKQLKNKEKQIKTQKTNIDKLNNTIKIQTEKIDILQKEKETNAIEQSSVEYCIESSIADKKGKKIVIQNHSDDKKDKDPLGEQDDENDVESTDFEHISTDNDNNPFTQKNRKKVKELTFNNIDLEFIDVFESLEDFNAQMKSYEANYIKNNLDQQQFYSFTETLKFINFSKDYDQSMLLKKIRRPFQIMCEKLCESYIKSNLSKKFNKKQDLFIINNDSSANKSNGIDAKVDKSFIQPIAIFSSLCLIYQKNIETMDNQALNIENINKLNLKIESMIFKKDYFKPLPKKPK